MKNFKVEFPFKYGSESDKKTYFEGIAIYFFSNNKLIFETAKITKIIFKPRDGKENTKAIERLKNQSEKLKIRLNVMKENEKLNDKNCGFSIELSSQNKEIIDFNDEFEKAKSTINSLYFYINGVNTPGQNKYKKSRYKINDGKFNESQFIQFFTYILGDNKTKQKIPNYEKIKETMSFNNFYKNELDLYYKYVFDWINKIDNDKCSKFENLSWKEINNEIKKEISENLENNPDDNEAIDRYVSLKQKEYTQNVKELIKQNQYKFDSVYNIYLIEKGYVQNCHIWEKNQIKKDYLKQKKIEILDSISDKNNVLFLTPTIHFLWDKCFIKLNNNGFFENIDLSKEEWDHLNVKNINVFDYYSEIKEKQIFFLKKRNEFMNN